MQHCVITEGRASQAGPAATNKFRTGLDVSLEHDAQLVLQVCLGRHSQPAHIGVN